ncbi:MAG TPA: hypothetical protein VIR58_07835 [Acidimicrobiales bacterium]
MTMTEPDSDQHQTSERRAPRRRLIWIVLAAAAAVAVVVVAVVALGDDGEDPAPPPVTSALPDPLEGAEDPDTAELAQLLEQGRAGTYHATYSTSGSLEGAPAAGVGLEVWRDGERLRQDSVATTEGQEVRTSSFLRATDVVVCSQIPGQDWACSTSSRPANDDGVFGSVTEQLAGSSVTAREAEVDGRAVRCFAFDGPSGTGELCVTPEGVPASIEAGGMEIFLAGLDADVPDEVFELPAEPAAGG